MAAQKGRDILIKVFISGTYTTIGGMRAKSIDIGEGEVDVSDSDSDGWRELLADASLMSVSISGNGVFKDTAAESYILNQKIARAHVLMQFVIPGVGTMQGTFQIGNVQYQGGHDSEMQFSMSFSSSGEVTLT
jgi:TP901-1 family phage major tail protein